MAEKKARGKKAWGIIPSQQRFKETTSKYICTYMQIGAYLTKSGVGMDSGESDNETD